MLNLINISAVRENKGPTDPHNGETLGLLLTRPGPTRWLIPSSRGRVGLVWLPGRVGYRISGCWGREFQLTSSSISLSILESILIFYFSFRLKSNSSWSLIYFLSLTLTLLKLPLYRLILRSHLQTDLDLANHRANLNDYFLLEKSKITNNKLLPAPRMLIIQLSSMISVTMPIWLMSSFSIGSTWILILILSILQYLIKLPISFKTVQTMISLVMIRLVGSNLILNYLIKDSRKRDIIEDVIEDVIEDIREMEQIDDLALIKDARETEKVDSIDGIEAISEKDKIEGIDGIDLNQDLQGKTD
ncbi:uncharacterized protein MELLADRAFT_102011 [Melampsora larici-populina 98AG31]|uniref:Uncharacterized protein n=1 Tax=Melampsora larici-populina (strain 98AG31 / pathotype 3-4-7) TaxID=747676 RepID=F4R5N9_MELLP|nr:uncharacterized protein MELLADRAFT_102011 [Melampsora larici-populina 98AG31]EGG12082.1 hypothetical protein MELLADRAFT_102011 [Melampsora larici-populina 98AG31]